MKTLRIRLTPDLDAALDRLRTEHQTNISAWVRTAIAQRLERDRTGHQVAAARRPPAARAPDPPQPTELPAAEPISGFRPCRFPDDTWGAHWRGDTSALPPDLEHRRIEVKTGDGSHHVTTILEVVQREDDFVQVRDAGW